MARPSPDEEKSYHSLFCVAHRLYGSYLAVGERIVLCRWRRLFLLYAFLALLAAVSLVSLTMDVVILEYTYTR